MIVIASVWAFGLLFFLNLGLRYTANCQSSSKQGPTWTMGRYVFTKFPILGEMVGSSGKVETPLCNPALSAIPVMWIGITIALY